MLFFMSFLSFVSDLVATCFPPSNIEKIKEIKDLHKKRKKRDSPAKREARWKGRSKRTKTPSFHGNLSAFASCFSVRRSRSLLDDCSLNDQPPYDRSYVRDCSFDDQLRIDCSSFDHPIDVWFLHVGESWLNARVGWLSEIAGWLSEMR